MVTSRFCRWIIPLLMSASMAVSMAASAVADAGQSEGYLSINGQRFGMGHAYAALQPDGFVPGQQSLLLVLASRELGPNEYLGLNDPETHVIRLDVGPDRFLRSLSLVDEALEIKSISGVGIAGLSFDTFDPPVFSGRLATDGEFEASRDRLEIDITFSVQLDASWDVATALAAMESHRASRRATASESTDLDEALLIAVLENDVTTAENLIDRGADVDSRSGAMSLVGSAAAQGLPDMVALLLSRGADATVFTGFSPLAQAIESGSVATVARMLAAGVDPAGQEMGTETLGIFAVRSGDPSMISALTGHVDFDRADSLGRTPILAVVEEGRETMAEIIAILGRAGVNLSPQSGYETPLYLAVDQSLPDAVDALLAAGADPSAPTREGAFPLMAALDKPAIARRLLDHGADPNVTADWGETALIAAVGMDAVETVALLLEHGADPNASNPQGYSARDMALNGGRDEIAALLDKHLAAVAPAPPGADALPATAVESGDGAGVIPTLQRVADMAMPGAAVAYVSSAPVAEALDYYVAWFEGEGWSPSGLYTDTRTYATAQFDSAAAGSASLSITQHALPTQTLVTVTLHGAAGPGTYPRIEGTEVVYEDGGTGIYVTDAAVGSAASATRALFEADGWAVEEGVANEEMAQLTFRRDDITVGVMVSVAPAQGNRTSLQYSVTRTTPGHSRH